MEKEKIEKYHNVIKNQIAQGKRLIQNIIKLTELEELKNQLKPINLNEKIIKAVSFIRESFSNKNIDVEVNMKKDKILVRANEFIEDILKNILMNAIRYNLRDPIEIQIITDTTRTKKKSHCRLEIIDNGMGIPPRRREPILKGEFEKSPDKKGLGIGLSVVDRLIELYDGDMWIENRIEGDYEKGSKFVLILPLSENL
jgi:signal transduction histidine kinase